MPDFIPPEYEKLVNVIFLVVTALIAHHGITYRNPDGEKDFVRLLFGCIAGVYFILVLFKGEFWCICRELRVSSGASAAS